MMKLLILILSVLIACHVSAQCDSISPLNKEILEWVSTQINKKVGTGQCWDLAQQALNKSGAKWDGMYDFGRPLAKGECVMPGDIIQFEKVKAKRMINGSEFREEFPHHTAVIFSVNSSDEIKLIHQNTGYNGKKVAVSDFYFSSIKSGKYTIYRPEK
jgi:hypothetical protein